MRNWGNVPEHLRPGIERYIDHHIRPGGFLEAVFANDLRLACERADPESRERLFDIVAFLYNEAPAACWGSDRKVYEWLKKAGGVSSEAGI